MAGDEALRRWWDQLDEGQRRQARRAEQTGEMSEELQQSLKCAGLLQRGELAGDALPADIEIFLKARH